MMSDELIGVRVIKTNIENVLVAHNKEFLYIFYKNPPRDMSGLLCNLKNSVVGQSVNKMMYNPEVVRINSIPARVIKIDCFHKDNTKLVNKLLELDNYFYDKI
jgi:hypothetical protein